MTDRNDAVGDALANCSALMERWMAETRARCWQWPRSPQLAALLAGRCTVFVESLAAAYDQSPDFSVGSPEYREPVKLLSFLAGWLAGEGLPISVGLALCHGLRAALPPTAPSFVEALAVVVSESYAAGLRDQAEAKHRQIIRKSQVVCMLRDAIAGLFLVGDPDREALDDAVGRVMMLSLMRDATHVVIDMSALVGGETVPQQTLRILDDHREGRTGRRVCIAGIAPQLARGLEDELPPWVEIYEALDQALHAVSGESRGKGAQR